MRVRYEVLVLACALAWTGCGDPERDVLVPPTSDADTVDDTGADVGGATEDSGGEDAVGEDTGGEDDMGGEPDADAGDEPDADTPACSPACSGDTPVCDEAARACVGCLEASDCAGDEVCDPDTQACVVSVSMLDPDVDGDGTLNVLILGTSRSIQGGGEPFDTGAIATELTSILGGDADVALAVNVVAEDIYTSRPVLLGLGGSGTEYTWDHSRHSLMQYYYWPEGSAERMDRLSGQGATAWDHVVIAADPHIVATLPGYYALGANTVAAKVAEGGAVPHLLMTWPRDASAIDPFVEHTRRVSDRAQVGLPVVAAGRAWQTLPDASRDTASAHPTPHGAYLAAASIYSSLYAKPASASAYDYDDALAQAAHDAQLEEATRAVTGTARATATPYTGGRIIDRELSYNHTGTSSERGILAGLRWVLGRARVALNNGGDPPIDFNYGRANTNFEPDKRYQVDAARFDYSLGFPMQDHSNHGDDSMLYGLDRRLSGSENGTDLGVALYMVRESELPGARAVPLRTLHARMQELNPGQSAYRDGWHMSRDLDKAIGAFMYTLLTGHCAVDAEPADTSSGEWREWMAHKVGYETAWTLMHMSGVAPCFKVLPEATDSTSVTPTQTATLTVSFMNAPTEPVTVTVATDDPSVATVSPATLTFTPADHDTPQVITLTGDAGAAAGTPFVVSATTSSDQVAFDGLVEQWRYTAEQD